MIGELTKLYLTGLEAGQVETKCMRLTFYGAGTVHIFLTFAPVEYAASPEQRTITHVDFGLADSHASVQLHRQLEGALTGRPLEALFKLASSETVLLGLV